MLQGCFYEVDQVRKRRDIRSKDLGSLCLAPRGINGIEVIIAIGIVRRDRSMETDG